MPINISTMLPEDSRKTPKDDRETVSERREPLQKTVSETGRRLPEENPQVVYYQWASAEHGDITATETARHSQLSKETRVLHFGNASYLATDAAHIGSSMELSSFDLFWSRNEVRGEEVLHG